MYKVLNKDTIKKEILSYLSTAKRGFDSKEFRSKCFEYGIISNTAINPRHGENQQVQYLMKCFVNTDIRLRELMSGWIHTGHCSIALKQLYPVGRPPIISL